MKGIKQFLVLVVSLALFQPSLLAAEKAPAVAWQSSWKGAQELSKRTGKPIFVYFHASWCSPCRALDKDVWPNALAVRASRAWIPFKADLDKETDLAAQFRVKAPPMIVFLNTQNKPIASVLGYNEAPLLSKAMKSALKKARR